jgi:septal ring factor EnvC (AmiA/AmiB activator)
LKEEANKKEEDKLDAAETNKPKVKRNLLIIYGFTLLAVAFALVLLSYLNEIRANRAEIANLKQEKEQYSISAMQDIQNLKDDNKALQDQVNSLSAETDSQKGRILELEQTNSDQSAQIETMTKNSEQTAGELDRMKSQQAAVEAMMRISELFAGGKYSYSAYEISVLEAGNSQYVSDLFAGTENGPMIAKLIDRYGDIRVFLDKRGYMDPERIAKWKAKNIKG